MFYYLMNLHYSQTRIFKASTTYEFYYLMNLHYSQTSGTSHEEPKAVLLPYEFTLLSNPGVQQMGEGLVLLPYEFTLLSN